MTTNQINYNNHSLEELSTSLHNLHSLYENGHLKLEDYRARKDILLAHIDRKLGR